MKPRVAVIGGGWAGCAAGLTLAEAGVEVTLFESGSTLGGRARAIQLNGQTLDNGQHILLGAYRQTLGLIAQVNQYHGQSGEAGLLRLPLVLDGSPDFLLACPKLPAPFHLLVGLLRARGFNFSDKLAAARWAYRALKPTGHDFDTPLADQIADQPERVRTCLWQPLCVSALNTQPEFASAKVFKQVLATAFGKSRNHSDMLFPSTDLTQLFPEPAAERIAKIGGQVHMNNRVKTIRADMRKVMLTDRHGVSSFDRVILAVAPQHIPRLCVEVSELDDIVRVVETYHYGPIATAYVQYPSAVRLTRPMLSLSGGPAQFVFDRGQTHGQAGLLAFVVSAASDLVGQFQSDWIPKAEKQLSAFIKLPPPLWQKGVLEKQATYTCSPNMPRPQNATPHPLIFLAGDYTAGVYPATLESATLSGVKSALAIMNSL